MHNITLKSNLLKDRAADLGYSTYELARLSGVPQSSVASILGGKRNPSATSLAAICDALDIDINKVFSTVEAEKTA